MAENIIAAIDESAGNDILMAAEAMVNPQLHNSGATSLGGLMITHSESATLSGGAVTFVQPNIIRIANCRLDFSINANFAFDLNSVLPHGCLPQVCFHIPFDGDICTPKVCVSWPTISIPVSFSDHVTFGADFSLSAVLMTTPQGPTWFVQATIVAIPTLNLGAASTALIAAIGAAVSAALLVVPLIGPFLALAIAAITAIFTIANVTGLLGTLLTPFVSGLKLPLFHTPQKLALLPASGPADPEVDILIQAVMPRVESTQKNELVVGATV